MWVFLDGYVLTITLPFPAAVLCYIEIFYALFNCTRPDCVLYNEFFVMAVSGQGLHPLVFSVYQNAFGLILLIPFAFFYERKTRLPLTLPVLKKYTILGFIGLEVLTWKHRCGQAIIVGVVASVSGAMLMTCYKGPALLQLHATAAGNPSQPLHELPALRILSEVFGYVTDPWKLGALCLVGNCFYSATFANIQSVTSANHRAPVSLAASLFSIGEVVLTVTGLVLVREPEAWMVSDPSQVIAIVYAGTVTSQCLAVGAIAWSISKTGPVLAASYGPLQAVATAILAFVFLKGIP